MLLQRMQVFAIWYCVTGWVVSHLLFWDSCRPTGLLHCWTLVDEDQTVLCNIMTHRPNNTVSCKLDFCLTVHHQLGKVIQMNQLDATMIYWSIRSAQHVSGNIFPIIRSVRLRYLQHMVSCKDGYTESYVVSYVICRNDCQYYKDWWMCSVVFRYWCLYAKCVWLNSSV